MVVPVPLLNRNKLIQRGLLAEYWFDERTGTMIYDRSGNGNHGIFGAGSIQPTWTTKGVNFDADKITVVNGVKTPNGYTVICIIHSADFSVSSTVIDNAYSTNFGVSVASNKALLWGGGATFLYTGTNSLPNDTWKMVTYSTIRGGTTNSYIGDVFSTTGTLSSDYTAPPEMTFGVRQPVSNAFYGDIAFAAIYDRNLSQSEITHNYNYLVKRMAIRGIDIKNV